MNLTRLALLALAFPTLLLAAETSERLTRPADEDIDHAVKVFAETQTRMFSKAVSFCASKALPEGSAIDNDFKTYLAAFASGSKAGLIEITQTDPEFRTRRPSSEEKQDLEASGKMGNMLLEKVQSAPAPACRDLRDHLASGSHAFFKEYTLQGHREYQKKRAEFCASKPKPKNCK